MERTSMSGDPVASGPAEPAVEPPRTLRTPGVHDIPGLVTCDTVTIDELMREANAGIAALYAQDQVRGDWVHVAQHIACAREDAFEYAADIFALEEWSTSLRNFEHVGNGLFRGVDGWGGETVFYARAQTQPESGCVDYLAAWDQSDELWIRNHLRFVDARPAMGRDGTMLTWSIYRHPYFRGDGDPPEHIRTSMSRPGREWIGEAWPYFPAIHRIEARNLKILLEHRSPLRPRLA
jgi:hypothetical protein